MLSSELYEAADWIRKHATRLLSPSARALALFGSFVRNGLKPESDIDLLCIGDAFPNRPFERSRWFAPLSDAWRNQGPSEFRKHPLSPLFLTPEGFLNSTGLQLSICREAWTLWDDGLVSQTLEHARTLIEQQVWNRQALPDGGWLWIPRKETA